MWGRDGPGRACLETLRGLVWWEHEVWGGDSKDNAQDGGGEVGKVRAIFCKA